MKICSRCGSEDDIPEGTNICGTCADDIRLDQIADRIGSDVEDQQKAYDQAEELAYRKTEIQEGGE